MPTNPSDEAIIAELRARHESRYGNPDIEVRWLGGAGRLMRISASYRGLDLEGDVITAKGKIIRLDPNTAGGVATLEVWIENPRGERSTSGEATVKWPR